MKGPGVLFTATLMFAALLNSAAAQHEQSAVEPENGNNLVSAVRHATERFKDVKAAEHAGYQLLFGCVTGPDSGAMGLHYVNGELFQNGVLDAEQPTIVIYEPTADGKLKLVGADFLVLADMWDKAHPEGPPQLMGQLFQYFDAPNRFGLPAFYTLHVWAWKDNPNGAFVNWHPHVSCKSYTPSANQ